MPLTDNPLSDDDYAQLCRSLNPLDISSECDSVDVFCAVYKTVHTFNQSVSNIWNNNDLFSKHEMHRDGRAFSALTLLFRRAIIFTHDLYTRGSRNVSRGSRNVG